MGREVSDGTGTNACVPSHMAHSISGRCSCMRFYCKIIFHLYAR